MELTRLQARDMEIIRETEPDITPEEILSRGFPPGFEYHPGRSFLRGGGEVTYGNNGVASMPDIESAILWAWGMAAYMIGKGAMN